MSILHILKIIFLKITPLYVCLDYTNAGYIIDVRRILLVSGYLRLNPSPNVSTGHCGKNLGRMNYKSNVIYGCPQYHDMNGLYNAHSFDLGPYEGIIFQFLM